MSHPRAIFTLYLQGEGGPLIHMPQTTLIIFLPLFFCFPSWLLPSALSICDLFYHRAMTKDLIISYPPSCNYKQARRCRVADKAHPKLNERWLLTNSNISCSLSDRLRPGEDDSDDAIDLAPSISIQLPRRRMYAVVTAHLDGSWLGQLILCGQQPLMIGSVLQK